jgi:HK97 family phage portal protein
LWSDESTLMAWYHKREPASAVAEPARRAPHASAGQTFRGFSDPAFLEYVRNGGAQTVSAKDALKNSAVWRSVELLSGTIGMLPLYVNRKEPTGEVVRAEDHPLYRVLVHRPNQWQTPFQFKQLMQMWVLVHGNAYAQIVRSSGRVVALNPLHPDRVKVDQLGDFSLRYRVTRPDGSYSEPRWQDILHLRGPSEDGITGISRVAQAADVISIMNKSQRAAERVYTNGLFVGGNLQHPGKLSKEARANIQSSMEENYGGAENAGRWIITEEGMTATPFEATAVDSQLVEMRGALVEEIGRLFGVPRPLLGVDDTSWGTGIEQLAILFVRFGLSPWFKAWEDAIAVSCMAPAEWGVIYPDFDERELLRGTIKDQFEAFAKASGAGGHKPWMEPNEIRDLMGLGQHPDGSGLHSAGERTGNEQAATA